jgi:hypothetical protein
VSAPARVSTTISEQRLLILVPLDLNLHQYHRPQRIRRIQSYDTRYDTCQHDTPTRHRRKGSSQWICAETVRARRQRYNGEYNSSYLCLRWLDRYSAKGGGGDLLGEVVKVLTDQLVSLGWMDEVSARIVQRLERELERIKLGESTG